MNKEESIQQLETLIEAWQLDEADLNQTDINAMQVLLKENKQLKMINKEYERLNKEKFRGFKIINVQEYNINELLSYKKYKDNWNKLKKLFYQKYYNGERIDTKDILDKMQELEQGSEN